MTEIKVIIGICGDLERMKIWEADIVTDDDETGKKEINEMLSVQGGCDVIYLTGKLFFKDGKYCLIAVEG